jgi:hypothetical protein
LEAEIEASAGTKTLPRIFITWHSVLAGNQVKIGDHCSSSSVAWQKGKARFPDGEQRTSYEVSFVVVLFLSRYISLK